MENKITDDNWICPHCGPVKPKTFYYSFPIRANCPKCLFKMDSSQEKKRPDLHKE